MIRERSSTAMAREIAEIPAACARALSERSDVSHIADRIRSFAPRFVVICGRGSSGHAGIFLRYLFEVRAGLLMAQTLNHGNEHRAHICTILGALGLEVPELDGWSWGLDTGRFTEDPVVHTIPQY